MLITEAQLRSGNDVDIISMLNEAVYLSPDEINIHPNEIPVVENSSLGTSLINWEDITSLAESANISYIDAICSIAEANDLSLEDMTMVMDEGTVISESDLFDADHMIVRPITEENEEFQHCLNAIEFCLESGNFDDLLDIMLESAKPRKIAGKKAALLMGKSKEEAEKIGQNMPEPSEVKAKTEERDKELRSMGMPGLYTARQKGAPSAPKGKGRASFTVQNKTGQPKAKVGNMNVRSYFDQNNIQATPMNDSEKSRKKGNERIANHLIQNPKKSVPQDGIDKEVKEKVETNRAAFAKMDEKKREEAEARKEQPKASHRLPKSQNWGAAKGSENQSDWEAWADKKAEEGKNSTENVASKVASSPDAPVPPSSSGGAMSSLKSFASNNKGKLAAGALGGVALGAGIYAYKKYKDQPKSVIGKRIAALRKIYTNFMNKARSSNDSGVVAKMKKVAANILAVIDKLMGYLQNKAG